MKRRRSVVENANDEALLTQYHPGAASLARWMRWLVECTSRGWDPFSFLSMLTPMVSSDPLIWGGLRLWTPPFWGLKCLSLFRLSEARSRLQGPITWCQNCHKFPEANMWRIGWAEQSDGRTKCSSLALKLWEDLITLHGRLPGFKGITENLFLSSLR